MPNITGTTGNDDIDVTNDSGTLNGSPQGSPIDNIRARGGNDTIAVTDSTISGNVRANGGADEVTITGSTVGGVVAAGSGGDTVTIQGSTVGNVRLGGGNDTLDFIASSVDGDIRGGGGNDSLNLPDGTVINDATFGTITVTAGGSYSLSSGTFTLPSGIVVTYASMEGGTGFPCFTRDTWIETPQGPRRVQQLAVGDEVLTQDNGPKPIQWIGQRRLNTADIHQNRNLRPVTISAGALGHNLPRRTLSVSRQHRMLVQSKIAMRMFGVTDVLIPAIKLVALPGIFVDDRCDSVDYFHLLFDQHEIIFAEGAPTESLYTGPEAMKAISPAARQEILHLFPELGDLDYELKPARMIPSKRRQRQLILRHQKHDRPLLR